MDAAVYGLIGVLFGGIITAFSQYYFGFRRKLKESELAYKEARYKALTLLMYSKLYPETIRNVTIRRPEIKSEEDITEELQAELMNGFLFMSDEVLKSFKLFLKNSNNENFANTVLAMRKDLWGRKTKISGQFIEQ